MTVYAYLRVSTEMQNTEKNKDDILRFCNYNNHFKTVKKIVQFIYCNNILILILFFDKIASRIMNKNIYIILFYI